MTQDDLYNILNIMKDCHDGGCPYCTSVLFYKFINQYPSYEQETREYFKEIFNVDLSCYEGR